MAIYSGIEVAVFEGRDGDRTIRCAISREALEDHFDGDNKGDFSGLRTLAEACKTKFAYGVVRYDSADLGPFGDKLAAAPLSSLRGLKDVSGHGSISMETVSRVVEPSGLAANSKLKRARVRRNSQSVR